MVKGKSIFICQSCGYESPKWMGRCPGCQDWNTMVEEPVRKRTDPGGISGGRNNPLSMEQIDLSTEVRNSTGMAELDRVLGGGIVSGSLVLVGGDPGIGKSTLLLQLAGSTASTQKTLYVSGEESVKQIKLRAERLGINGKNIFVFGETDIDVILEQAEKISPDIIIVDSI